MFSLDLSQPRFPSCNYFQKNMYSFLIFAYGFFACTYVCESCGCLLPRREHQIPWKWSYRRLWVTTWMTGIQTRSNGRRVNSWVISPTLCNMFFLTSLLQWVLFFNRKNVHLTYGYSGMRKQPSMADRAGSWESSHLDHEHQAEHPGNSTKLLHL